MVFKRDVELSQVEPTGGRIDETWARRQRTETASAPAERTTTAPNSAQRRSAERMRKHCQEKQRAGSASTEKIHVEPGQKPGQPPQVDSKMREADAGKERAGKRRTTGEPLAGYPHQAGKAADAPVEATVRKQATENAAKTIGHVETTRLMPFAASMATTHGTASEVRGHVRGPSRGPGS